MKIKFWLLSLLVIVAIFANNSCNSSVVLSETEKNEISNTINKMAECWNNGNIDCYMNGYWNSDQLVFIGSSGLVYGWQTVLDRYKGRYPDKATRGELKLEVIKLDKLSLLSQR